MAKEGYKPTSGMAAAARRAIKWKEQGKAKGAGTAVGWTRAGQLARGETLSLSTVKRMYSFFSRHEVDKKGKDFNNSSNPSNGKIMWEAWGGDAGFSWSRKIVNREKNVKKSISSNELLDEIKDILDDAVNPIDTVVEIPDDEEIQKALRSEVTREQLYAVVQHLHEAIEGMLDDEMDSEDENPQENAAEGGVEEMPESEMENIYKSDNEDEDKWDNQMQKCWTGYKQVGMKDKNGRQVPNCVPVAKMDGQVRTDQETLASVAAEKVSTTEEMEAQEEPKIKKSLFENLDPYDLIKRKFTADQRKKMADQGKAMPDGSYPIASKTDLMNAIRSWGRGGADPKVKAHIKSRAKALGLSDMIPENWK